MVLAFVSGVVVTFTGIVAAEIKYDYSLGDWLKDNFLKLIGKAAKK